MCCNVILLTLLHPEWPKLRSFGHSGCNRAYGFLAVLSAVGFMEFGLF